MNPNLLYKIALKKYEKASKAIDSLTKDVAGVFPDYDNKRALMFYCKQKKNNCQNHRRK